MTASQSEPVLHELDRGVALFTLHRPERLNAWSSAIERRYFDLLEDAASDPEVRAIVLTGAGRGFCAGADMDDLGEIARSGGLPPGEHRPQSLPLGIPKPIIAAINGACAGIGLVQALMCDVRFAAAGAKLTTAFARRGLVAEHGISWILPRLVGPSRALDLLLSGRVVLAEEALAMGLVDRVVPGERLLAEALAYARELATHCSPTSMAAMKLQVYRHLDAGFERAVAESNELMAESLRGPDFPEGVASFVERRVPNFPPLGEPPSLGPPGGA